ncbi:MAG: ADP-ribosylglycohydrolase family protein [Bacteroidales bacterium]
MIGAIIGDIIGSTYEGNPTKNYNFELFTPGMVFTDDTVLTIAVADALLHKKPFDKTIHEWGNKYPNSGYGFNFSLWLADSNPQPYNSFGNGSAMRVSPVGFFFNSEQEVLQFAKRSAEVTHNHPEGIKGAQAVALAIFLAKTGKKKEIIKSVIVEKFNYDLNRKYQDIKKTYSFDVSCQGSVPEALVAFLESTDFESAIRLAIALGGDADTQACIAGGIAEAYYKSIPKKFTDHCLPLLTDEMHTVINKLYELS